MIIHLIFATFGVAMDEVVYLREDVETTEVLYDMSTAVVGLTGTIWKTHAGAPGGVQ